MMSRQTAFVIQMMSTQIAFVTQMMSTHTDSTGDTDV